MDEQKNILTPAEVAEYLGIGRAKCYELFRTENFPVLRLGRLMKVAKSSLDEWVKSNSNSNNKGNN